MTARLGLGTAAPLSPELSFPVLAPRVRPTFSPALFSPAPLWFWLLDLVFSFVSLFMWDSVLRVVATTLGLDDPLLSLVPVVACLASLDPALRARVDVRCC